MAVLNLSNTEYFKLCLEKGYCKKSNWYFEAMCFKIPGQDSDTEYGITIKDGKYNCKVGEDIVIINNINPSERPVLHVKDPIVFENNRYIANLPNALVETTVGRAMVNYILLANNFGSKIPYINSKTSTGEIEGIIAKALGNDEVTVAEYIKFVDSCSFIQNFSKIVTIAATLKNMLPPEGLEKRKKELAAEYDKIYGPSWRENSVQVGQYLDELHKFDMEYLKGDPTIGKVMTKKVLTNSRKKCFIGYGQPPGMNGKKFFVEESLYDGYPKNNTALASIIDESRSGSYNRGHETQEGGTVAKIMLRVSNTLKVTPGDCGSKVFLKVKVNKELASNLNGLWMKSGNGIAIIEDGKKFIGQEIEIRTPLYCKAEGTTFCGTCVGKNLENRKSGINLLLADIAGAILKSSLKKMHNTQIVTGRFSLEELVR